MSNHIHLIISTKTEEGDISAIIRDFKKFTWKAILEIPESRKEWLLNAMSKEAKRIGRPTYYKLWKDDNRAITIDGKIVVISERLNYIHDNPIRLNMQEWWVNMNRNSGSTSQECISTIKTGVKKFYPSFFQLARFHQHHKL